MHLTVLVTVQLTHRSGGAAIVQLFARRVAVIRNTLLGVGICDWSEWLCERLAFRCVDQACLMWQRVGFSYKYMTLATVSVRV